MKELIYKHWGLTSIAVLFLAALWIIWSALPDEAAATAGKIPAPTEGFLAPDFELTTLQGETVRLSDYRGQAVLVNFWASWCPPCRSEMPAMEQIYQEFSPKGFVVLAVNSITQDNLGDVQNFVAAQGLNFPILLDTSGQASADYQVRSLPTSFFIDPDGIIREVIIGGPMAEALLRTRAENLLPEVE